MIWPAEPQTPPLYLTLDKTHKNNRYGSIDQLDRYLENKDNNRNYQVNKHWRDKTPMHGCIYGPINTTLFLVFRIFQLKYIGYIYTLA